MNYVSTQLTKVRNFLKFSNFGDWIWMISGEFLMNGFLWLIPQKFSGNPSLQIPNFKDFLNLVSRNFWEFFWNVSLKILGNFTGIYVWKLLKNCKIMIFLQKIYWLLSLSLWQKLNFYLIFKILKYVKYILKIKRICIQVAVIK